MTINIHKTNILQLASLILLILFQSILSDDQNISTSKIPTNLPICLWESWQNGNRCDWISKSHCVKTRWRRCLPNPSDCSCEENAALNPVKQPDNSYEQCDAAFCPRKGIWMLWESWQPLGDNPPRCYRIRSCKKGGRYTLADFWCPKNKSLEFKPELNRKDCPDPDVGQSGFNNQWFIAAGFIALAGIIYMYYKYTKDKQNFPCSLFQSHRNTIQSDGDDFIVRNHTEFEMSRIDNENDLTSGNSIHSPSVLPLLDETRASFTHGPSTIEEEEELSAPPPSYEEVFRHEEKYEMKS